VNLDGNMQSKSPLFPDGRDYRASWDSQPRILEEDGKFFELVPQHVFGGAGMDKKGQEFSSQTEAARYSCDQRKEPKPTRMWIATLADYKSEFDRLKKEERMFCRGYDDMVEKTMKVVRAVDPSVFYALFGDGYHYGFNRSDGSISHGYLMQWRPNGGWNLLHISMVHMYYGK
jgi:hypothetical protein